jgi:hypothetical protein
MLLGNLNLPMQDWDSPDKNNKQNSSCWASMQRSQLQPWLHHSPSGSTWLLKFLLSWIHGLLFSLWQCIVCSHYIWEFCRLFNNSLRWLWFKLEHFVFTGRQPSTWQSIMGNFCGNNEHPDDVTCSTWRVLSPLVSRGYDNCGHSWSGWVSSPTTIVFKVPRPFCFSQAYHGMITNLNSDWKLKLFLTFYMLIANVYCIKIQCHFHGLKLKKVKMRR